MKIPIVSIFTLFLLVNTSITSAQEHTNSWLRGTLSIPISEKITTDVELQHRTQNGFENRNPWYASLMNSFRTWIYFKQNKDVVYAISPFAYFQNNKIIQQKSDADLSPTKEFRFSASIELQHELASKFFIVDRTMLEYRVFENTTNTVGRLRNRLSFRYDFNSNFNTSFGDEIFINAKGADAQHLFDQDRLFANFTLKASAKIKFDFGYIYISRLLKNKTEVQEDSNFYINCTYKFQKKHHKTT